MLLSDGPSFGAEVAVCMINHPLDFELPLVQLESQLEALREEIAGGDQSKRDEFARLEKRVGRLRSEIYGRLTAYQKVQLSRHFDRPFTLDFIAHMLTDFVELHGDRRFRDDPAVVGGTGAVDGSCRVRAETPATAAATRTR